MDRIPLAQVLDWSWISSNLDTIWAQFQEHVFLTVLPVSFGFLIAFPLALVAIRWPNLYSPLLGMTGVLFSIPTLALFVVMIPFTGLSSATAIIPLTLYTLLILIRNTVEGLASVPRDVSESAEAMGYRRTRRLFKIELPLALPVIVAGLRIATVNTIAYVAITSLIGQGGLGRLMLDGFQRQFPTPLIVGLTLAVAFAVATDLGLLSIERALTPWKRARS
ncbi:MAG: ABC transporter permease [Rubrobacteraceae bacterium]